MPCTLKQTRSFNARLKEIVKEFPQSQGSIAKVIENLPSNPESGDLYPGFALLKVRKLRIPLREYGIGKSKGLRLIYLTDPSKMHIRPLVLYHKPAFRSEQHILNLVLEALREIAEELEARL
jgi:hypothetical protein